MFLKYNTTVESKAKSSRTNWPLPSSSAERVGADSLDATFRSYERRYLIPKTREEKIEWTPGTGGTHENSIEVNGDEVPKYHTESNLLRYTESCQGTTKVRPVQVHEIEIDSSARVQLQKYRYQKVQ